MLERARLEFKEELGATANGAWIDLGSVKQKGGKLVHAWAFEGELEGEVISNTFTMEWPPRSGTLAEFPEIDRAEFFSITMARLKINPAQVAFLDRLEDSVA